jgi:restriction system protein
MVRGWLGEKKTTFKMWLTLNSKKYKRFHNVIIPSKNGTTQIDHLIVSPFRVFIVETKNMKGWLFGSEDQANWTQVLFGAKYSFQNPLRQTFRQKKVLAEYLGIATSYIHPVVYFVGDCTFKTEMPPNVIKSRIGRYIKQFKNQVILPEEIDRISGLLDELVSNPSFTTKEHVQSLHERHNSETTCPKCGSDLVERTVRQGDRAGSTFLGCARYPRCRYTKNID